MRCSKYCDKYVCLSVRLSVRSRNSKTTLPNFTELLCMLPVTVAWSSSDGVATFCKLAILWMTSCFHTVGPMGHDQARRYVYKTFGRWRCQLDVRQLQCLVEFIRIIRHHGRSLLSMIDLFPLGVSVAYSLGAYADESR